jgi:hypothetical protein
MLLNDSLIVLGSTVGSAYILATTMNIIYNNDNKRVHPISDFILGFTFGFSGSFYLTSCFVSLHKIVS